MINRSGYKTPKVKKTPNSKKAQNRLKRSIFTNKIRKFLIKSSQNYQFIELTTLHTERKTQIAVNRVINRFENDRQTLENDRF